MSTGLLSIQWTAREPPLAPLAVAAAGPLALRLAERVLQYEDDALVRLSGVSGAGLLLLLGDAERLPWTDGAIYLGRDPEAPSLLLPTTLAPAVPASLVERAIALRFPALVAPVALLPQLSMLASAAAARSVDRAVLTGWLQGQRR